MHLSDKQESDRVLIDVYLLDQYNGWTTTTAWVPRKVALSHSQDAFLAWSYEYDSGESWRNSLGSSILSVFVESFEFEEPGQDSVYVDKGTTLRIARPPSEKGVGFQGAVGDVGTALTDGRVGPGAGLRLMDLLLTNGNEVTVYAEQLEIP